jgi:hypothetical protein
VTGPAHYQASERLLDTSNDQPDAAAQTICIRAAQVHATLALAAATALGALHAEGWADVAAAPRRPAGGVS